METVKDLQNAIREMEEHLSLRQVAIRSGINYLTLRNIKFGKSERVTDSVVSRLMTFRKSLTPSTEKPAMKKRGPKPKAVAASAAPAAEPKKRGRKPNVAAPAAPVAAAPKKRGRKPKVAVAASAAPAAEPKKRGRKPKVAAPAAPVAAAPKKRGRKPGVKAVAPKPAPKKRGRKPGVKPAAAPVLPANVSSLLLGPALKQEIAAMEARLAYLRSLEKVEADFIAKLSGKK